MRRLPNLPRAFCLTICTLLVAAASPARGQQSTAPNQDLFPAIPVSPLSKTPLTGLPYVFRLKHLEPSAMAPGDASAVDSFTPEIEKKAALMNFDLSNSGWQYRQISCPAFPDYIFLAYSHAPDPDGSSRFVAALNRSGSPVLIVPSVSHGAYLNAAWGNPSSYAVFNRILLEERGRVALNRAPNWLVISLCYAEFTGNHVQAFTARPLPGSTVDLTRLGAKLPQLNLSADQGAIVTFSDASKPAKTTNWTMTFDREGQLMSVSQDTNRQPPRIALKP